MFGVFASVGSGVHPHMYKCWTSRVTLVALLACGVIAGAHVAQAQDEASSRLINPPVSEIVTAAGDTNGPAYPLQMSRYEVTNAEFVRFLNSAEANPSNALGENVYIDLQGNAWINPEMRRGRDELFSISKSRLVYSSQMPVGQRYSVARLRPRFGGNYERHPVTGMSWFGAVKYCNWLTLATGVSASQRCYREGTNTLDWAPVTCAVTNWSQGLFKDDERERWLRFEGYRLPMDASRDNKSEAGRYSEFYHASSWDGTTNRIYGFGRDVATDQDANIPATAERKVADTLPVGFFTGNDHAGEYSTVSNQNFYGLYDVTGNVEEWLTDFGSEGSTATRAVAGSSWRESRAVDASRKALPPNSTSDARGLRTTTTAMPDSGRAGAITAWTEYDCDQYGGVNSLASTMDNLDVYVGAGEIVLDVERWKIQDTNNLQCKTEQTETFATTDGEKNFQIRIGLQGSPSMYVDKDRYDDAGTLRPFTTDPRVWVPDIPTFQRMYYSDVYPGIDAGVYGDLDRWELVFVSRPGADLSEVSLFIKDIKNSEVDGNGNMVSYFEGGKLVLGRMMVHQATETDDLGNYVFTEAYDQPHLGTGAAIHIDIEQDRDIRDTADSGESASIDGPELELVSSSGDTNGPAYDFYMSKFEISNKDLVKFLNSAESNTNNLLGTNMVFDSRGNIWMNEEKKIRRDEMFSLADSRLVYARNKKPGGRYSITARKPVYGESYTNHPATGISWYGAAKYCNWLTLATGRGADQLCYREGTNAVDWAPITCSETNWQRGVFTDSERTAWVERGGFRMAMETGNGTNSTSGPFSEFTKAASWTGKTNSLYAYGRDDVQLGDANYNHPDITTRPDTFPVGFFDGSDHDGTYPTRANQNLFGLYDMSGNVDEWVNDVGLTNSSLNRAFYGGSWQRGLPRTSSRLYARAYDSSTSRGFRVVSTQGSDDQVFVIRIPLYICVCGYLDPSLLNPDREEGKEDEGKEDEGDKDWNVLTVDETSALGEAEGILISKPEKADDYQIEDDHQGGGGISGAGGDGDDIDDDDTVEPCAIQP